MHQPPTELIVLIDGQQAAAELPAARPTAPEQNGSETQSGCQLLSA
jgi:hypothetical protein